VSPRITAVLAVVLALVVGYIVLVDRPQAKRAEEAKHLIQVTPKDVTRIALISPKGTVDLTRRDAAHWDITSPIHVPAGSYAVSSLLDTVVGVVPQQSLGTPSELKEYGLDKPTAQITVATSKGQTVTLQIGNASPVGSTTYARVQPGGGLYQIDTSTKDALAKSANDLRQKTVADFANADVQKVKVVSPAGTLVVNRVGADRWKIEGAHAWPADDFKVTDLFFPLTTSEAKSFHDGVTDLAPYDLNHPAVTVDLTLRDRQEPVRILLAQRGKVTYATLVGTQSVLELDASVQGKLTVEPLSLVSRRILPYNPQNLTSFVWRREGQVFELRRQGPGFTGAGLTENDISNMFSVVNLLDADQVEALTAAPAGAPAFEIQTDGASDATFLVQLYRDPKGGWTATNRALALRYHLQGNAFDSLPAKIKTFLALPQPVAQPQPTPQPGKPAPPAGTPPKPNPPAPAPPKR
jgi:Domain of unknown function (DUF4340)